MTWQFLATVWAYLQTKIPWLTITVALVAIASFLILEAILSIAVHYPKYQGRIGTVARASRIGVGALLIMLAVIH